MFELLLTVLHLSIFISVFNQLDAQNLFHNKFYYMPLHVSNTCAHHQEVKIILQSLGVYFMPLYVSSTCAHHQEVKIALHSLWYRHTYPDDEHMC